MTGELTPRGGQDGAVPQVSQLRASHEDRDTVIELLRVAAGDGRLTAEELDERLGLAFNARTYGELATLTDDLPTGANSAMPAMPAVPVKQKDLARINCGSGHATRDGKWIVPKRLEIKVSSGHVRLDLTDAVITHPVLDLDVEVRSGHLAIITRPGIAVDADDVQVRSGHVKVKSPWSHSVPVTLQISVTGKVGSGHIIARPPRRSFWQWLTRQPPRYALPAG